MHAGYPGSSPSGTSKATNRSLVKRSRVSSDYPKASTSTTKSSTNKTQNQQKQKYSDKSTAASRALSFLFPFKLSWSGKSVEDDPQVRLDDCDQYADKYVMSDQQRQRLKQNANNSSVSPQLNRNPPSNVLGGGKNSTKSQSEDKLPKINHGSHSHDHHEHIPQQPGTSSSPSIIAPSSQKYPFTGSNKVSMPSSSSSVLRNSRSVVASAYNSPQKPDSLPSTISSGNTHVGASVVSSRSLLTGSPNTGITSSPTRSRHQLSSAAETSSTKDTALSLQLSTQNSSLISSSSVISSSSSSSSSILRRRMQQVAVSSEEFGAISPPGSPEKPAPKSIQNSEVINNSSSKLAEQSVVGRIRPLSLLGNILERQPRTSVAPSTATGISSTSTAESSEGSLDGDAAKSASVSATAKPLCCDKCDGKHETDNCPYYKKQREDHPDAKAGRNIGGTSLLPGSYLYTARVIRQPGDGSCLFHSMSYGLGGGYSATRLRSEICSFIQANPNLLISETPLKDWVKWDSGSSVTEYSRKMSRGSWGGGIEMACLSQMKQVNVHVYERSGIGYKRISAFDCAKDAESRPVIKVLYCGGIHYGT